MNQLPVHPRTGLTAIGIGKRGPIWPVMGGSEPPVPPVPPAPVPPAPPNPAGPPTPPGPAGGKDAVLAELAEERDKRQALEKQVADLAPLKKLADLLGSGDPGKGPTDIEAITARLDAQDQVAKAANLRAARSEVKALAADWADPADAALYLGDMADYLTKDGIADETKIKAKLAEVLAAKPHLAKQAGPPARGGARPDPSQGPRGGGSPAGKDAGMAEARKRFGPAKTN